MLNIDVSLLDTGLPYLYIQVHIVIYLLFLIFISFEIILVECSFLCACELWSGINSQMFELATEYLHRIFRILSFIIFETSPYWHL